MNSRALNLRQRGLRCLALAMLVVYVGWQVCWAVNGQIAPSLFLALTGWPAATTGGTRSLQALMQGDWRLSVYHNPATIAILFLMLVSASSILRQMLARQPVRLAKLIVVGWVAVLTLAWMLKLVQTIALR